MNEPIGMPGPGGSLGQCALCGGSFIKEILLGEPVQSFSVNGCNQTLYGHNHCLIKYAGKDAMSLPETSPLRQAYEQAKLNQTTNQHQP